ncbi:pyruvate formate lyase family protein [Nocardia sp. NBC_01327]|uniref:pyruvate formate lyase family protein n=1 Tax=Nocardia sp. NBC_01327 TaxID=2903593 RepID=UPI002E146A6D|nr:hypothetical protein OG326_10520 [Nocardia sp. NBC_01327]
MTTIGTARRIGAWDGFTGGLWRDAIDVRDFIQQNYTPYAGDDGFLSGPTARTLDIRDKAGALFTAERERGGDDVDQHTRSSIIALTPRYLDVHAELILGLPTDVPTERDTLLNGDSRNDAAFDDYSLVALYGVDRLLAERAAGKAVLDERPADAETFRLRAEVSERIRTLWELKSMAASYGFDIGRPAATGREAIQWLYFAHLAAVREQRGATLSLGRTATFLDIYLERDLESGLITEEYAQELMDDFLIKLHILSASESGEPFSGEIDAEGRTPVTRTSFRCLQARRNLDSAR